MPSHWLDKVSHLLYRTGGWVELTKATWLAHSVFLELDLLIPTSVVLFPMPFLSPSITILTLTDHNPNRTHDWKMRETLFQFLVQTSNKREFFPRLTLHLALIFPDSLTFRLLFSLSGMSFDYLDLLADSYLSLRALLTCSLFLEAFRAATYPYCVLVMLYCSCICLSL